MKKQIAIIGMALALAVMHCESGFAQTEYFPDKSEPGTTITCSEKGELIKNSFKLTLKEVDLGKVRAEFPAEEEKKIVECIKKEAESLPKYYFGGLERIKAEPGMVAYYDGDGALMNVTDRNGKRIDVECVLREVAGNLDAIHYVQNAYYNQTGTFYWGTNYSNSLTRTATTVLAEGRVTWYDDTIGNHDNILTSTDCATSMTYDRPPNNKQLHVRNLSNNIDTYLYKNDVGGLPDAILDIRPEIMQNVFGVHVGPNIGSFTGRYFYYI